MAAPPSTSGSPPLPQRTIILYALPFAAYMAVSMPINVWLMKHATDVLLLAPATMGLLIGATRLWDAVSDPMAGYLSDRTRSRFGRRRAWILGSAPAIFLSLVILWSPPVILEGVLLVTWMAVALVLWETASTAFYVPYLALGLELTPHHHDRTRLFAWRHVIGTMLGFAGGLTLVYFIRSAEMPRTAATNVALIAGGLLAGAIFLAARMLDEPASHQGRGSPSLTSAFKDVFRNPHARILFIVYGVESFGMGIVSVFAAYILDDVVGRPEMLEIILACWMIPQVIMAPFWIPASRRLGKKRLWLCGIACTAVGFGGQFFLGPDGILATIAMVLMLGIGSGIANVIGPSIQADVVDYDEIQSGERKEGAYTAVWNFIRKAGMAGAAAIGGPVLGFVGYDGDADVQSELVIDTIVWFVSVVPATLYGVAFLLFRRFSLTEEEHGRISQELALRREAANPAAP